MTFTINGRIWKVIFVEPNHPELVDRTGELRVATTNPVKNTVFLSRSLHGDFLRTVLIHELGHVAIISYSMLPEIHSMVKPKYWIEMEEYICNVVANLGTSLINLADNLLIERGWDQ